MHGRIRLGLVVIVVAVAAAGCKKSDPASSSGAPGARRDDPAPVPVASPPPGSPQAPAGDGAVLGTPVPAPREPEPEPRDVQSQDILERAQVTPAAQVKHILIGWGDLPSASQLGPRAMARTRAEADALALRLLERIRNGEAIEPMMREYSEDPGSAETGDPYPVRVESDFVEEFERFSLRLNRGEAGIVRTAYGYHIIQRVE
jgi:hypothetical protein